MQMQISTPPTLARTAPPRVDQAPAEGAGTGEFANLLQQQAEPEAPDTETEAPREAPAGAGRDGRTRAPARSTARATERPADARADAKVDTPGPAEAAAAAPDPGDGATDPALLDWMAALHLPTPALPGARGPAAAPADAVATDDAASLAAGATASPRPPLAASGDAAAELSAPAGMRGPGREKSLQGARGATATAGAAAEFAAEFASARAASDTGDTADAARLGIERPANARHGAPADVPSATAFAPAANATPASQATAPVAVPLTTPLHDPQFARAFGVQVSVLARDGVQQAELHLNPAEMGPVAVQIVMDGTQARIEFGADAAGTRQLIEQSLPDLAAALREAGLTLSGGGVSQHPSGRDAGDARPPERAGESAAGGPALDATTAPVRRTVRRRRGRSLRLGSRSEAETRPYSPHRRAGHVSIISFKPR